MKERAKHEFRCSNCARSISFQDSEVYQGLCEQSVITQKTIESEIPLDYEAINDVNADIRSTERLLEANLKIKKENDANRKSLQNTLIILKEKRHNIIFGNKE